ncbi:MAG: PAS domain S-box protein [Clostridiales bacterium]|nr:PAS domain S-box protein [Clostridiales bacterium]
MSLEMVASMIDNALLLLALCVIYAIINIPPYKLHRLLPVLNGLLIAAICIIIMSKPFKLADGLFFDTRSILISVTALTFGTIPTALTIIAASVYRIILGGSGTLPGIAVIFTSALIGLIWRRWLNQKMMKIRWLNVYLMGIAVHITMLGCMLFISYPENLMVVRAITLPVIVIFPITSMLLSLLLMQQQDSVQYREQLEQSDERFRALFDQAPLGYQSLDINGCFIDVNQQWLNTLGYSREEVIGKWFGDFLSPPYRNAFCERFPVFKAQGQIHSEFEMIHKNGTLVFISFEGRIGYEYSGEFKQTHCILQDITEERKAKQNYQLLFHEMLDGFSVHEIICDNLGQPIDYRFISVNPAFESMVRRSADEIIGRTVREVFPGIEPYWIEIYGRVALTGVPVRFENYSSALGKHFSVSAYQPMPGYFACTFVDITKRRQLEEQMQQNLNDLMRSQRISHVGTWRLNLASNQVVWSEELYRMYGFDSSVPPPPYTEHMKLFTPESWNTLSSSLEKTRTTGIPYELELETVAKDGSHGWMWVRGEATKNSGGMITDLWGAAQDITERKKIENKMRHLSTHDYLTGLKNRRYFDAATEQLNSAEQLPLSFIIGDINGLKLINDTFGRKAGDTIIIETAKILDCHCNSDSVLAKTGGDEFSILLPKTNHEDAVALIKQIQSSCMEQQVKLGDESYQISISFGTCTKVDMDTDMDEIYRQAEANMNQHKLLEKRSSFSAIISSIQASLSAKSHETEAHSERLMQLVQNIGVLLNLSQIDLDHLNLLAKLHDIGKIGINEQILSKPGRLTDSEWIEMKKHPEIGWRIALSTPNLAPIAEYILCHHERWDGNGYPRKLAGKAIPLLSRILTVVDAYDAMTQERVYRKAISHDEAMEEIMRNSGTQFDPQIVQLFKNTVGLALPQS